MIIAFHCPLAEKYQDQYCINSNGDYKHINFKYSSNDFFSLTETIDDEIKIL